MPPRHGKSELSSKYFPAWYMGTFPERNVIWTSATDELATDFSGSARDILAEHGQEIFGVTIRRDRSAAHRWALDQGGEVRAAGVGGGVMGRGAHLLGIDDYAKNVEEALSPTYRRRVHQWFHSTSTTRLTPDGAIVIIATRWHPNDLIGMVLKEAEETGEHWERVRMPALGDDGAALWPEQFSREWLERRRASYYASGYPWMWEALYQQNPPEVLDALFQSEWFGEHVMFDEWPPEELTRFKVVALDPSMGASTKSDYSAFVKLVLDYSGTLWVEADLERRDPWKIVADGIAIAKAFKPDRVVVETNGFQAVLRGMFAEQSRAAGLVLPLVGYTNSGNKKDRILGTIPPFLANGEIRFKRRSGGTNLLLEQLKGFPSHKFDDGPDALQMAIFTVSELARASSGAGVEQYDQLYT
jgi:predicted phage terminase large subunit-like protein